MTNQPGPPILVGHGWDLHRLESHPPVGRGRPLVIAGVPLKSELGPVAHSDGDALLHAVTDAILGALAQPDIGQLFPDSDPRHDNADSAPFLVEALRRAHDAGYQVSNLDCTLILERPRLAPIKERIRARLGELLDAPPARINIKGKTHERVDAVGEGRAIEAHAVVLLTRKPSP